MLPRLERNAYVPKLAPRTKKIVRGVGTVLLIGVTVAANVAVAKFGKTLNSWVSTDYVDVSTTEYNARMAQDEKLAEEEEAEGAVLLQNKDHVLPFSKDVDKVNVFGWSSTQWVASGSGSGQVAGKTKVSSMPLSIMASPTTKSSRTCTSAMQAPVRALAMAR
jgi:beta-glucosidase